MAEKYPELVGLSENSKIKQKLAISWTQRECKNYQARGIFPQSKAKGWKSTHLARQKVSNMPL